MKRFRYPRPAASEITPRPVFEARRRLLQASGRSASSGSSFRTPFAAGSTLSEVKFFVVTNVIANDAAASAGNVNIAEVLGGGAISSGA